MQSPWCFYLLNHKFPRSNPVSEPDTIRVRMPEVSRFFGNAIRFYYNDHEPAHFHAVYGEYEGLIEIDSLAVPCFAANCHGGCSH